MARVGYRKMLRGLSVKNLQRLELDVAHELDRRQEVERAKSDIQEQIKAAGFSMSDLVRHSVKKRVAKNRYAHKKDPSKVWSGFGRKPTWVRSGHGKKI